MQVLCKHCHGNFVEVRGNICFECVMDAARCSPATAPSSDAAQVTALTKHLGGSDMTPKELVSIFGHINRESQFGASVVDGLVQFVSEKYWPRRQQCINPFATSCATWLGVFQTPEVFSKAHAAERLNPSNVLGANQYPALFYVPWNNHKELMRPDAIRRRQHLRAAAVLNNLRRQTPHHPRGDIHLHIGAVCVSGQGRKPWSTCYPDEYMQRLMHFYHCQLADQELIEVPRLQPPGDVWMVCFKIAIARSRPWRVSTDFVHFLAPYVPREV